MSAKFHKSIAVDQANGQFNNFELISDNAFLGQSKELLKAILIHPELWEEHKERQLAPGSPHKYTRTIFLRAPRERTVHAAFNDLESVDYPAMEILTKEVPFLIQKIIKMVGGFDLARVMIAELAPAQGITPHFDDGNYADHFERFHLSLYSENGNVFSCATRDGCGEFVHMRQGELWWFNHKAVHFLYNGSNMPRVHLIIDCVAPNYRVDRMPLDWFKP